jgi:hypothetical protein
LQEAMLAAEKGIVDQVREVRQAALGLLKQLMIKMPDETKKIIQAFLNDPSFNLVDELDRNVTGEVKKGLCDLIGQTERSCIIF